MNQKAPNREQAAAVSRDSIPATESSRSSIECGMSARPKTTVGRNRVQVKPWIWLAAASLLIVIVCAGLGAAWVSGLDISKLEQPLPEPSLVLDADGRTVAKLASSKVTPVGPADVPIHLKQAVIAVEDRRFYEHRGFDLRAMARALYRDVQAGSFEEGGSTITQQLAKNMFLNADKTVTRKLMELAYALKIHYSYTKDDILLLYLNSIYFGEGRWGVESAALHYFGKRTGQLSLTEAALLAGLPKAPSRYSPVQHPEAALERRNLVLQLMREQQLLTESAYTAAVAEPLRLQPAPADPMKGQYSSFVDHVLDEAEALYGFTEQQVLTMGLRIHTTIDQKAQQAAEAVLANASLFPPPSPDGQLVQAGVVVMDPANGKLRAIVGGRGKPVYRGFNRATELKRQPGSAFKPIAVYGPALEQGYGPQSRLYDGELNIGGYRPRDWDGRTRGEVSLTEAVTRSWNIPAVWLLNELGIDKGLDFAARAGMQLPAADRQLGLALGGLSEGVSPLQMAQAYSALANLGTMHDAHAIERITTMDGQLLAEAKPQARAVTEPRHAFMLTSLLREAVASGTGQSASLPNRPVAGKTGTTQLPDTAELASIGANGAKDAWFVGYTPELTAAIWVGYDRTDSQHYLTTSGGSLPAVLFRELMSRALEGTPVRDFPVPPELLRLLQQQQAEEKARLQREEEKAREKEEKEEKSEKREKKEKKERAHERSEREKDDD
ncbi:transglycosylase domain-containing protein [Paenibacillus sp. YYML68]|uniref:transglycosylase domain-containing protein n=1 Tax=Paenibacillus sp. YYML68 TaxID=2909250 RepID=UPI002491F3D6|nr:PBP1A family penicillin-binding protein [Paenibacillus sp. YYML68]